MPLKKAKHTVEKESNDLPCLSVLVNKKAIKAHERLAVLMDQSSKDELQESSKDQRRGPVMKALEKMKSTDS